jgi:hypothetical protein
MFMNEFHLWILMLEMILAMMLTITFMNHPINWIIFNVLLGVYWTTLDNGMPFVTYFVIIAILIVNILDWKKRWFQFFEKNHNQRTTIHGYFITFK